MPSHTKLKPRKNRPKSKRQKSRPKARRSPAKSRPFVSAAIIAKDEAEGLERAVTSARQLADEVVIGVDDRSTDGTWEIAQRIADIVYRFRMEPSYVDLDDPDHGFCVNFAKARNECGAKCTGEWILVMDGDEELIDPTQHLKAFLKRVPPETDTMALPVQMDAPDGNTRGIQIRMYRNHQGAYWTGEVHNELLPKSGEGKDFNTGGLSHEAGVYINHIRTPKKKSIRDPQRARSIVRFFEKVIRDDPENGRALYYLGAQSVVDQRLLDAIEYYHRYLDVSRYDIERARVLWNLAFIWAQLGNYQKQRESLIRAISERWDCAEAHVAMGEWARDKAKLMFDQGVDDDIGRERISSLIKEAERHYLNATSCQLPTSPIFSPFDHYTWLPWHRLAQLYYDTNLGQGNSRDLRKCFQCCEKVLEFENAPQNVKEGLLGLVEQTSVNLIKESAPPKPRDGKPTLVIFDRIGSFTKDLARHFAKTRHVEILPQFDSKWLPWADVIWYEWCDENLINGSQIKWPETKTICRLHSYEAFAGLPAQVTWENVDRLVFVSEHLQEYTCRRFRLNGVPEIAVIPNGVDLNRLTYRPRSHGGEIAVVGYLNHKKGVDLLAQLIKRHEEHTFHIAGPFQEENLLEYCRYLLLEAPNVIWSDWIDDINAWLDDKNYLLSTSIVESFGYSIAEAMAKGIKPIILDRPGAKHLWPEECVAETVFDVQRILTVDYDSPRYRQWVDDHYSLEQQLNATDHLLADLELSHGAERNLNES